MPWLALTVEVAGEQADALGDALLESGAQSVLVDEPGAAQAALTALLDARADGPALLARASLACGVATPRYAISRVADEDWVRRSQSQFAPLLVGERLWIGPGWHQPPRGRIAVRLDPGLAFGTGSHISTRLVLDYLEQAVRGGESLLDYGCGSGILAIAAARLGAAKVDAVDIDPQAVETAAANAHANAVELRAMTPEALPPARYDIVVANILAQPLILLAPVLAARTASGGRIALSGILEAQAAEVASAYAASFEMRVRAREGWALVQGARR